MSSMNVLEVLINKSLSSPEFQGFVEKPQQPNEAEEVFGLIQEANPLMYDDPRQEVVYDIFAPHKSLAGFVARGATEYSRIGTPVVDRFTQGLAKIGVEHSYTSEDVAAINMYQARFNGNVIDNYQAFLRQVSMNPTKLTDAIANTIDVSAWFGQDVVDDLRQNKALSLSLSPNSKLYGIFNNPNITQEDVANDGTGSTDAEKRKWINKDVQKIVRDLRIISNDIQNSIYQKPDTVVVSNNTMNFLNQTIANPNYSANVTYMDVIKRALPDLNFVGTYIMNEISTFDNKGDRFIMFKKNPQWFGIKKASVFANPLFVMKDTITLSFKSATAGVLVKMPKGIRIVNGI